MNKVLVGAWIVAALGMGGCAEIDDLDDVDDIADEDIDDEEFRSTMYTYAIRVDNKATAYDIKIYFRCGEAGDSATTTETKTISGSSSNSKSFDCKHEPIDNQNPAGTSPPVYVKFKWKNAFGWHGVKQHYGYGWYNWDADQSWSTTDWVRWINVASDKSSSDYDQKACFDTWDWLGIHIQSEMCT